MSKIGSTIKYREYSDPLYDFDIDFTILDSFSDVNYNRTQSKRTVARSARFVVRKYLSLKGSPSDRDMVLLLGIDAPKRHASNAIVQAAELIRQARPTRYIKGWSKLRNQVFARDNNVCGYCGVNCERPHCDHIHPWSLGGSDTLENLVTSCETCNLSKKDKVLSKSRLMAIQEFITTT